MTKSPTVRLFLGLLVTLLAVTGFSWYALNRLSGLRELQKNTIDVNRHDSLLLLGLQNDLNRIGLLLRDITQSPPNQKVSKYHADLDHLRDEMEEAIRADARLRRTSKPGERQTELQSRLDQFGQSSDRVFEFSAEGNDAGARDLVATELAGKQANLAAYVSHLIERNTEAEQEADERVAKIYRQAEVNIYLLLAATMIAIAATTLYLIQSNGRLFERLEVLSGQRRVLAARLITVQEEVLRSVSRELHDEFGQILTAVGAMLARAERKGVPPDSPLRTELTEVRQITHNTLEKMRSLSQMLHPAVLDDYGLAKGIEWYTEIFQKQTGIRTESHLVGTPVRITGQAAIHCFRIVQEALTNTAKHSGAKNASVDMIFATDRLTVTVHDDGRGFLVSKKKPNLGLGHIAMQERAEILHGTLEISSAPERGTTVWLTVPLSQDEAPGGTTRQQDLEEVTSA